MTSFGCDFCFALESLLIFGFISYNPYYIQVILAFFGAFVSEIYVHVFVLSLKSDISIEFFFNFRV